jgi:hypothetical protein
MSEHDGAASLVRSDALLAILSDEEARFRGMQKIMEQDGQADTDSI